MCLVKTFITENFRFSFRIYLIKFSGNFAPIIWYTRDLPTIAAIPTFPAKPDEVAKKLGPLSTTNKVFLLDYLGELTDPAQITDRLIEDMGFDQVKIHDFSGVGFIREYQRK